MLVSTLVLVSVMRSHWGTQEQCALPLNLPRRDLHSTEVTGFPRGCAAMRLALVPSLQGTPLISSDSDRFQLR